MKFEQLEQDSPSPSPVIAAVEVLYLEDGSCLLQVGWRDTEKEEFPIRQSDQVLFDQVPDCLDPISVIVSNYTASHDSEALLRASVAISSSSISKSNLNHDRQTTPPDGGGNQEPETCD